MFEKILVPLDGSALAEEVFPYVLELAEKHGSTLILLNVVEPIPTATGDGGVRIAISSEEYAKLTEETKQYLSNLVRSFTELGINVESIIDHGPVVSSIVGAAEREKVDLVAIASHGRTGVAHTMYGSVAAGLLYQIQRPLMVIRAQMKT